MNKTYFITLIILIFITITYTVNAESYKSMNFYVEDFENYTKNKDYEYLSNVIPNIITTKINTYPNTNSIKIENIQNKNIKKNNAFLIKGKYIIKNKTNKIDLEIQLFEIKQNNTILKKEYKNIEYDNLFDTIDMIIHLSNDKVISYINNYVNPKKKKIEQKINPINKYQNNKIEHKFQKKSIIKRNNLYEKEMNNIELSGYICGGIALLSLGTGTYLFSKTMKKRNEADDYYQTFNGDNKPTDENIYKEKFDIYKDKVDEFEKYRTYTFITYGTTIAFTLAAGGLLGYTYFYKNDGYFLTFLPNAEGADILYSVRF